VGFPEDCAGREDLLELIFCTSLAPAAQEKKGFCIIEVWAPWMSRGEAEALVAHVWGLDIYERTPTARTLGNRLRLTNAERERLRLWTIKPFDMSDKQLADQSKARERARRERKRRDAGVRSRVAYLAEMKAKPKPWIEGGVSRRTWFRRVARGRVETIVTKPRIYLVPSVQAESQKGFQEGVLAETPRITAEKIGQTERTASSESALRIDIVPRESSPNVQNPISPEVCLLLTCQLLQAAAERKTLIRYRSPWSAQLRGKMPLSAPR
jgi:hypothetical protein